MFKKIYRTENENVKTFLKESKMKMLKHNKLKKNEKLKHYKRKEIKILQSMVHKLTTVYMYVQVLVYISQAVM